MGVCFCVCASSKISSSLLIPGKCIFSPADEFCTYAEAQWRTRVSKFVHTQTVYKTELHQPTKDSKMSLSVNCSITVSGSTNWVYLLTTGCSVTSIFLFLMINTLNILISSSFRQNCDRWLFLVLMPQSYKKIKIKKSEGHWDQNK